MRTINFIKNEHKFERGDMVKIKNVMEENYKRYNGQLGYIVDVNYAKKDCIFNVKFEDKTAAYFKENELIKIDWDDPIRYKKLNIEI